MADPYGSWQDPMAGYDDWAMTTLPTWLSTFTGTVATSALLLAAVIRWARKAL